MSEAQIIDGKAFAANLRGRIAEQVAAVKEHGKPGLAVILVGEDDASQRYVANKEKATIEVGMESFKFVMADTTTQEELLAKIDELNNDNSVHGILVQLPLPKSINEKEVINAIIPAKDVDGFHVENVGKLATGQADAVVSCTPKGCLMLIKDVLGDDLSGKNALVIGRSNIVGKPMAALLTAESCTVTIAHSRTKDVAAICRDADILVSAVGIAEMVKADWVKPGAVVIDVGMNRNAEGKLCGDVDFAEVKKVAGAITPVPGGVGPMTIACLLQNTLEAFCRTNNISISC
jgi:methylenetetrahydrofolate dehydrogenase (NADP+)/methenyltetrahydrofolate cyclohydrolase